MSDLDYYIVQFRQPVDHADPEGPSFLQRVSLLHGHLASPMVVWTSGYWDYYEDRRVELTTMLEANQISIEHRFFGTSRPDPADWSKLTIEQMANDQHRIVTALRTLYDGAFIAAGASKGGMTAVYYRRFFPDDVDGTVPYVAPLSFGTPDIRYATYLDTIGPPACRQAVRDFARELLANRRAVVLDWAALDAVSSGHSYTRIPLGPAVESAIVSFEWSFWQYFGGTFCNRVPATTASDTAVLEFLDNVSPVSDNADERIGQFDAYYHQAYHQLGYPDDGTDYLEPYMLYTDADYLNALPAAMPEYDGSVAMRDIDAFVKRGDRFIFIYGEWDPWTGGQFELGLATDSLRVAQAEGNHGARISRLDEPDHGAVYAKLRAWTGVEPLGLGPRLVSSQPDVASPRLPPAMGRALRARRVSP
jgi:hypothetical protein